MGASRLPVGDEPMAFKNVEDVLSYREENDQVVLTMSREDYAVLVRWLNVNARPANFFAEFRDRLQEGDPNYTPYQVGEKK